MIEYCGISKDSNVKGIVLTVYGDCLKDDRPSTRKKTEERLEKEVKKLAALFEIDESKIVVVEDSKVSIIVEE